MVGPVVFAVDDAEGAGLDVDGVNHLWRASGPLGFEGAAGATGGRGARNCFPVGIASDADEEGFVAIEGVGTAAALSDLGEFDDRAFGFGVEVEGNDVAVAADVGFASAPSRGDGAGGGCDDLEFRGRETERGQVDRGEGTVAGVENEFISFGGVAVLVEVKAGAALIGREADDAVTGVGVDPVARGWRGGEGGGRRGLSGEDAEDQH